MSSTRDSFLMVKTEPNTDSPVKPTNPIRYKSGDIQYNAEVIENNPIQNNRWASITPVEGEVDTSGSFELDLDPNECVHWLQSALGSMTSTDISSGTDGSAFRHVIDHSSNLKSLTVEQAKGNVNDTSGHGQTAHVNRAFGVMVDGFTLSASAKVVNLKVDCIAHGMFTQADLLSDAGAGSDVALSLDQVEGLTTDDTVLVYDETPQSEEDAVASIDADAKTVDIATLGNSYTKANKAKVQLAPQTPSFATAHIPLARHQVEVRFGSSVANASSASREKDVEQLEVSYMNNLSERRGLYRATPTNIAPTGNKMTLSFTRYFKNRADFDAFKRIEKKAMVITCTNNQIISDTDTNNATYKVRLEISDLRYTQHDLPTGVDDLYAVQIQASAFYDDSDGRAFRMVVENSKAGSVFA